MRSLWTAVFVSCLVAVPAGATSFDIFESSLGAPGVTAQFGLGAAQIANIDFDADSAEGGGLSLGGPSEVTIVPTGSLFFAAFSCEMAGCIEDTHYSFTPGGAGIGQIVVSDPNQNAQTGIVDLGLIEFDIASAFGTIELTGCNYAGGDAVERQCDPFTLVNAVPEPGTIGLLALGLVALALRRRV